MLVLSPHHRIGECQSEALTDQIVIISVSVNRTASKFTDEERRLIKLIYCHLWDNVRG